MIQWKSHYDYNKNVRDYFSKWNLKIAHLFDFNLQIDLDNEKKIWFVNELLSLYFYCHWYISRKYRFGSLTFVLNLQISVTKCLSKNFFITYQYHSIITAVQTNETIYCKSKPIFHGILQNANTSTHATINKTKQNLQWQKRPQRFIHFNSIDKND